MNDHLFTNSHGLRLITQFEGAPRLKARECEGGKWEVGYGVTFDLQGNPFKEGDTCTEDQAMAYFRNALERFENAVRRHVTVELTSNQFSALVAFCYNIGEANFAGSDTKKPSTVLRETNAGRYDDAAVAFGMWLFATKNGHQQALRGLLRRRYAEACLYLGYDWVEACEDDAIALKREIPAELPGRDAVIYKTPFKDVLRVAQRYPLPPATQPAPVPKPAQAAIPDSSSDILVLDTPEPPVRAGGKGGAAPTPQPSVAAPAPSKTTSPSAGTSSPPAIPVGPIVAPQPEARPVPLPAPKPVPPPPLPKDAAPAGIEPKDMVLSKRFWGLAITAAGTTNFLPRGVNEWINNEGNRELLTWLAVVAIGLILFKIGQAKATRPLK